MLPFWRALLRRRAGADVGRLPARLGVDRDVDLLAERLELLHRGRALHVGGDQQRPRAALAQLQRQLAGQRRLAGALQADQHDHRRASPSRLEPARLAEHLDQLVVDDLDDLLGRVEALEDLLADRPLADPLDEALGDLEVDVGLEQRAADLLERLVDVAPRSAGPCRAAARRRPEAGRRATRTSPYLAILRTGAARAGVIARDSQIRRTIAGTPIRESSTIAGPTTSSARPSRPARPPIADQQQPDAGSRPRAANGTASTARNGWLRRDTGRDRGRRPAPQRSSRRPISPNGRR